jgi:hypothetical protein
VATTGLDGGMLGVSILHDGYQTAGAVAGCHGVLYHCLYRICELHCTISSWALLTPNQGATLVFYAALFPRLARYMHHVRKAREEDLKDAKISQAEYDKIESLERNHVSSISTAHSNIGYLLTLVINLSVLLPLQGNPFGNNLALCLTNSCEFC